jgi:hypothetical protein
MPPIITVPLRTISLFSAGSPDALVRLEKRGPRDESFRRLAAATPPTSAFFASTTKQMPRRSNLTTLTLNLDGFKPSRFHPSIRSRPWIIRVKGFESSFRRDAETSTRDARATQSYPKTSSTSIHAECTKRQAKDAFLSRARMGPPVRTPLATAPIRSASLRQTGGPSRVSERRSTAALLNLRPIRFRPAPATGFTRRPCRPAATPCLRHTG